jgi:hypothetical protein
MELKMSTVTIQIGNSDDKLKQSEWSDFVTEADSIIGHMSNKLYFLERLPEVLSGKMLVGL